MMCVVWVGVAQAPWSGVRPTIRSADGGREVDPLSRSEAVRANDLRAVVVQDDPDGVSVRMSMSG